MKNSKMMLMHLTSVAVIGAMMASAPSGALGMPRMEVPGGNVEKLLADVTKELERVGSDVKQAAEAALSQNAKSGQVSAETKAIADKALTQFNTLSQAVTALEGKLEGVSAANLDLSQRVAQGGGVGGGGFQTVGQEIVQHEGLKAWLEGGLQGNLVMQPKQAITVVAGGLVAPTRDNDVATMPMQRLPIRALLTLATTDSDVIKYAKQTVRTNNAEAVAPGAAPAAPSVYTYAQAEAVVRKIVAFVHASDEALADAGQLQSLIDDELRYDLDLEEEAQILAGDGTGQNLSGLITEATAFSAAAGLPNTTRLDRLRLGILQSALANYATTGITLNPVDWAGIELLKDTTGRYIFGDPGTAATPRLWGADVVPTLSHSVGEWMAGNFKMAATLHDRMATEILISSEHATNFVEGMKTIKGTKRLALAVKRPGALITGDFTFA
jgi:HK97 family phage major capsid protein